MPALNRIGRARLSLVIYAGLFLVVCAVTPTARTSWPDPAVLAFWVMAIGVVLLSAPLTWTMATVSLLPAIALVPVLLEDDHWRRNRHVLGLLLAGLFLVVLDERPVYHEFDRDVAASALVFRFSGSPACSSSGSSPFWPASWCVRPGRLRAVRARELGRDFDTSGMLASIRR